MDESTLADIEYARTLQLALKDAIKQNEKLTEDLSQCIDKISGVDEGEDILIVKYDIGDITDSSTINPVEFMALNQNGEVLDLSPCENSIVISYPISSILNSYISRKSINKS